MSKTPRTDAWTWNKEGYDTPMEALTKFAECLEVELGVANERIKRLEQAGDRLAGLHLFSVWKYDSAKAHVDEWRKSKEAKP